VLIRDIKRALAGDDFFYFEPGGGKPKKAQGTPAASWESYFLLFNNYKNFGLPHGKGWLNELPWVIDFLGFMNRVYSQIEAWQLKKGGGQNDVSPGEVGL